MARLKSIDHFYADNPNPSIRAQQDYLAAIIDKYKDISLINSILGCTRSCLYLWRTGQRAFSPESAYMLERQLSEKSIRYITYLRKSWKECDEISKAAGRL